MTEQPTGTDLPLSTPQAQDAIADLDAALAALADRPDLVVMPQIDDASLTCTDPAEIIEVFRGNRARATHKLLAD